MADQRGKFACPRVSLNVMDEKYIPNARGNEIAEGKMVSKTFEVQKNESAPTAKYKNAEPWGVHLAIGKLKKKIRKNRTQFRQRTPRIRVGVIWVDVVFIVPSSSSSLSPATPNLPPLRILQQCLEAGGRSSWRGTRDGIPEQIIAKLVDARRRQEFHQFFLPTDARIDVMLHVLAILIDGGTLAAF